MSTTSWPFEPVEGLPVLALTDEGLGNTSWLLNFDGDAVVVDPARDPAPYLAAAEAASADVVLSLETHLHADFVSGSRELAARGASVGASASGGISWPHQPLVDGDELRFGRWTLQAAATPGHTPEHLSYLLVEDGRARAAFTGGSLMVGSVARTDLISPDDTEGLTRALWRSINHRLLSLPDDVVILPTHGAGSFCAAAGDAARWTTVGRERESNPLLGADDEDDFVHRVLAGFGSFPPYFLRLRDVNRLGPPVYRSMPALATLDADDVTGWRAAGALLVDARSVDEYAAGHVPGSLANTLRPQFASWLGWLVPDPGTPLIFVVDRHTDRRELVRQCLNIGYENLAGEIDFLSWRAGGGDVASVEVVGAEELDGRRILDVRQLNEFVAGHVPGAVHVELGAVPAHAARLPHEPIVAMCGHGERAATAASVLEAAGRSDVAVLVGGPGDWASATGGDLAQP